MGTAAFNSLAWMLPVNFQFNHTNILTGSQVRTSFAITDPIGQHTESDIEVTAFYKLKTGISRLPHLKTFMKSTPLYLHGSRLLLQTSRQFVPCITTRIGTLLSYSRFHNAMCFIIPYFKEYLFKDCKQNTKGFVLLLIACSIWGLTTLAY